MARLSRHPTDLLSGYLDGELSEDELAVLVEHLEACGACVAEFHDVKEARAALRTLPTLDLPGSILPPYHLGDRMSAYLDGELTTGELEAATAHLAGCGDCRDELHEVDAARTAVRALPKLEMPAPAPVHEEVGGHPTRRLIGVAVATVGAVAAAALVFGLMSSEPVAPLDLDRLATRHNARVFVDPGISVLPASLPSASVAER